MKNDLESLLLEMNSLNKDVDKQALSNKKSVIENTTKEAVLDYIGKTLNEDEDKEDPMDTQDEFEETDVDADTGIELDADGQGEDMDTFPTDDEDSPMEDMPDDMNLPDQEDEVMDLRDASEEEVLQAIKNLPPDGKIEIVKKATFDVSTNEMGMGDQPSMDVDDVDMDMDMDMGDDADMDMGGDDMDMDDDDEDLSELDEMFNEMENVSGDDDLKELEEAYINSVDEACSDDKMVNDNLAENKLAKKLYRENQILRGRVKQLKENEVKAIELLKESKARMMNLALLNSNLAYVTRLFTENSTSKKEKEAVIKKFDKVKTVNESKLVFEMINESLSKRTKKLPKIEKKQLQETTKAKKLINEETTYINEDEDLKRIDELMNY